MFADYHMHTSFSADADRNPEKMIQAAIEKGLHSICITDHMDKDYFMEGKEFVFDVDKYYKSIKTLAEKYKVSIDIRFGIELGLQPHLKDFSEELISKYPFDFVIGSVHTVNGKDPYFPVYYDNRSDADAYREALQATWSSIESTDAFDVLGHMDYVVRYGKNREAEYSYRNFSDEIDTILKSLIHRGKGIELNTGGWKYGLTFAHPHKDVLKRYKELGGEIITVGSDAHIEEHIAYDFHRVSELLKQCGFEYVTEFKGRKPIFKQIM